jgi:hypothetical protein
MHAVRATHASRAAGPITTHRRSRVSLALLGVVLAAAIAPGIASADHGRPHADVYLGQLQQDFAIEYPGHHGALVGSAAILDGYQRHFAIEYPSASTAHSSSNTFLGELQRHFAIEYPTTATSGHGSATHYGPPGR